ncbi:hypothetical protein JQN44_27345, partial [Klebsiella pneumoniae]|uniref:hypothetical protein n=1 Tax=Klebsiella pneumoniae TaxID=573 RepID=UPI00193A782F
MPEFNGFESESAYEFINDFIQICSTFKDGDVSEDIVYLRLFLFALKNNTKQWLHSLPPQSIFTWEQMQTIFLNKYFPHHQTLRFQEQLSQFVSSPSEKFYQSWERFKDLLRLCPHHGFDKWHLVKFFH